MLEEKSAMPFHKVTKDIKPGDALVTEPQVCDATDDSISAKAGLQKNIPISSIIYS